MDISLTKLPWYAQLGAFVLLAGAGVGTFYYYYELPTVADLTARRAQLLSIQASNERGRAIAKQLTEFRREVQDLEGRLNSIKAVLPEEKDAGDLLRRMQTVATESNLTIKSFKPAPIVTKQLHAEWPISLELGGTYHNLAIFFDRVGKFTRIVNISGLDLKAMEKPDPNVTISATCVATTFVLLDKPTPKAGSPVKSKPKA